MLFYLLITLTSIVKMSLRYRSISTAYNSDDRNKHVTVDITHLENFNSRKRVKRTNCRIFMYMMAILCFVIALLLTIWNYEQLYKDALDVYYILTDYYD